MSSSPSRWCSSSDLRSAMRFARPSLLGDAAPQGSVATLSDPPRHGEGTPCQTAPHGIRYWSATAEPKRRGVSFVQRGLPLTRQTSSKWSDGGCPSRANSGHNWSASVPQRRNLVEAPVLNRHARLRWRRSPRAGGSESAFPVLPLPKKKAPDGTGASGTLMQDAGVPAS